jgi:hypothetical protein
MVMGDQARDHLRGCRSVLRPSDHENFEGIFVPVGIVAEFEREMPRLADLGLVHKFRQCLLLLGPQERAAISLSVGTFRSAL